MNETPQEYTARILGYLGGVPPLKILAATPVKMAKLLKGVSRAKLSKRPQSTRWSVLEVLAHLADSELVMGYRIRLVLGSNEVAIQAYDQDVWAEFSRSSKQDPKISFDAFRIQRERTLRLLKQISPAMWEQFGIHSERGKETVTRMAEMLAGHDLNHLKQIENILRPKANKSKK